MSHASTMSDSKMEELENKLGSFVEKKNLKKRTKKSNPNTNPVLRMVANRDGDHTNRGTVPYLPCER
jgi:hypothetical protein